jgi:predicted nucleic acid-binding protein
MKPRPRLFLDTSALFAGIWSAEGGARMLLKLGEAGVVDLLVSSQVLDESEDVIRRKAAPLLVNLALLLDRSQASVVGTAPEEIMDKCRTLVSHPGDRRILADAWHNRADFLVTLDRAHFLDVPHLAGQVPFPIGTPGDCLTWVRQKIEAQLSTQNKAEN